MVCCCDQYCRWWRFGQRKGMRWSRRQWKWTLFNNQFTSCIGNMKKMLTIRTRMLNSDERLPSSRRCFSVKSIWKLGIGFWDWCCSEPPSRLFFCWASSCLIRSAVTWSLVGVGGYDRKEDYIRFCEEPHHADWRSVEWAGNNNLRVPVLKKESEFLWKTAHAARRSHCSRMFVCEFAGTWERLDKISKSEPPITEPLARNEDGRHDDSIRWQWKFTKPPNSCWQPVTRQWAKYYFNAKVANLKSLRLECHCQQWYCQCRV